MQHKSTFSGEADRLSRAATMKALGISPREERHYSLSRAMLGIADGKSAGYEAEVHQQICRMRGIQGSTNSSVFVPTGLILARDMTAGTANAGGYLVATDNLGGSFIDLLRKKAIVAAMGATFMPGLVGNVTIPRQTDSATAQWLTNEAATITESQLTLGQLAMSPKTVSAYTEFSRQLLLQSNPAVDTLIANDLAKVVALAIDAAALSGTGASGQPTGISNTAGIGSVTGTSLAWAGILEFLSDIAGANVADPQALGFVTTPAVAALLMQRQRFTGTDSPLWQGSVREGKLADVHAMTSTGAPASTMICGDWASLLVGEWGFLELASNPFANFQAGIVGVRALQSVDIGVRRAGAFSMAASIT
jgi:HK97 family phage major capsid protein